MAAQNCLDMATLSDACSAQDRERRQTCTSQKQQNDTSIDYDQIKVFIYEGNRYACMLVYIHTALVQTRERERGTERARVRARKAIFGVRDVTPPKCSLFVYKLVLPHDPIVPHSPR